MNRNALVTALTEYQSDFPAEKEFVPRFLSLIRNFPNCYERSLLSGHMTVSAWIIDRSCSSALLVHHKKLNRWLQPGGHADGEDDILHVAEKEAIEETGLTSLELYQDQIFDVDIHLIPKYGDVRSHFHFDIRFLFTADKEEAFIISDESNELAWMDLDAIADLAGNNLSIERMILKSKSVFKRNY